MTLIFLGALQRKFRKNSLTNIMGFTYGLRDRWDRELLPGLWLGVSDVGIMARHLLTNCKIHLSRVEQQLSFIEPCGIFLNALRKWPLNLLAVFMMKSFLKYTRIMPVHVPSCWLILWKRQLSTIFRMFQSLWISLIIGHKYFLICWGRKTGWEVSE